MFSRNLTIIPILGMMGQGCATASDKLSATGDWQETVETPAAIPTFAEYKNSASLSANGSGYLVETDMYFSTEDALKEYYDELFVNPVPKSIINTVSSTRDVRSSPVNIRYCFCAGWGEKQGTYTAPALAGVRTAIQQAMTAWQGVAKIQFFYMSNLDGATCTTTGTNPGVDFVVQHWDNSSTAVGPFPSNRWRDQQLKVPTSGISRLLAIHELGHTLGLRHEHIHSSATPQCSESDTHYEELTSFDTLSCMKYSNCTTGLNINGTEISVLDGVGIRMAYGPPDWWWAVMFEN